MAVLVASRGRGALLARCVNAIAQQTRPTDDLVIVDDASDPPIEALPFIRRDDLPMRIVRRQRSGGPGRARNDGWRVIDADYVAITDDDCRPAPTWLSGLLREADQDRIVVGRTEPDPHDGPITSVLDRTMRVEEQDGRFSTCNILYPRALLEAMGGFNPTFKLYGEDTDLGQRALAVGAKAVFAGDALVYHTVHRMGWRAAVTERWRRSEIVHVMQAHPAVRARMWGRHLWKEAHPDALKAISGTLLSPMTPAALLLTRRWLDTAPARIEWETSRYGQMSRWERRRETAALALLDTIEVAACAWGSARHRTLFL